MFLQSYPVGLIVIAPDSIRDAWLRSRSVEYKLSLPDRCPYIRGAGVGNCGDGQRVCSRAHVRVLEEREDQHSVVLWTDAQTREDLTHQVLELKRGDTKARYNQIDENQDSPRSAYAGSTVIFDVVRSQAYTLDVSAFT